MTFLLVGSRSLFPGVISHVQQRGARSLPLLRPGYGPQAWCKRRHLLRFRFRVARRRSVEPTTCLGRQRSIPSMQNSPQSQILMPLSDWPTLAAWSRKQIPKRARWCVCPSSIRTRSEEHTSELQSPDHLVCRLLLEKKKSITVHLTIIKLNSLHTKRKNIYQQLNAGIHMSLDHRN